MWKYLHQEVARKPKKYLQVRIQVRRLTDLG